MTHKERIQAALRGEALDRPPVALWRHFPRHDAQAEGLAQQVIAFQRAYDFDLVKVTPAAGYPAEAWGAELYYLDNANGTRGYRSRPVGAVEDWTRLPELEVTRGVLARELEALRLIRAGVGPDVPVLQTVFSPLTIAKNLSDPLWRRHLREAPEALHAGLSTITRTMKAFARACLEAGADGIFFATQLATRRELSEADYRTFGTRYDLEILEAIRPQAELVLLHAHGEEPWFELLSAYPADVLNWHDRRTLPSLAEGHKRFSGAVLGGLNEYTTLVQGTPEQVRAEAREAIRQTGGRRFILGAGCVTLLTTPPANLRAAREAVES